MVEQREKARQILLEVLNEEPNNYSAQSAMRTYYLGIQDTLRADSLTRSILLNPATTLDNKVVLLRQEIGYSESNGGDSTHVLNLFREMLAQPEPSADIAEFCAAYMNLKKMPRDSVSNMLKTVLQLAPDNASARLQLVQYAWEADDNASVVSLCQSARLYNPDEMAFYYYQGMAYYRQEDVDHALEAFQNGISVITEESNPAIVSDFYAVMGDLLHQKGREREAYAAYDSCLQWKPDNVGCLNNYAYYLSELGQQLEKAEQMSFKAIKAEPENGTYLDTYAWILFMQKRYKEALDYIRKALEHDTTGSSVIIEHAGDINFMNGYTDEAVTLWEKALKDDPNNKTLKKKIKRKKYIR
jgi:tetratricopeptide (TPR) repeat protein